jgi:arginine exporter protein ArgO
MNCIYGTGIYACATVDAGIGVNNTLVTLLADGVNRTGILTCCTVCAIVSNCMGHSFTSL